MESTNEKCAAEPRGLDSARIVTVIETKAEIGHGTPEDPFRIVAKYWGLSGELLGVETWVIPPFKSIIPHLRKTGKRP